MMQEGIWPWYSLNLSETLTWALKLAKPSWLGTKTMLLNMKYIGENVFITNIIYGPARISWEDFRSSCHGIPWPSQKGACLCKMVTALNVYNNDGNDFYQNVQELLIITLQVLILMCWGPDNRSSISNDAAARAIGTIKHNFTSININNYKTKPMHH